MRIFVLGAAVLAIGMSAKALDPSPAALRATEAYVPASLSTYVQPESSPLRELVDRFTADKADLVRFYSVKGSTLQTRRLREFYRAWLDRLEAMDFSSLGVEGRIDATLLKGEIGYELKLLDRSEAQAREIAVLVPFAEDIASLQESRRLMQPVDPQGSATALGRMTVSIHAVQHRLDLGLSGKPPAAGEKAEPLKVTPVMAARALHSIADLQKALDDWDKTYDSYDPAFTWWTHKTFDELKTALKGYTTYLHETVLGVKAGADEPIIGDPIGREGLQVELDHEMIPYSPEQLIDIANREFAWCDVELKKASHEMGFGDDWKAALEKVKQDHLAPGEQPMLVRRLALEAMDFVRARNLVTIPPLSADVWNIVMMPPEQQKVAPFFLGGPDILVAFPTDTMDVDDKNQSLRSNNVHFARATVFHELVPGHHLQFFYLARYNQHRELFMTPFWVEGWALWWERYLWDLGFPQTPEDKMGMLFWRAHRCARIIFSLNFHTGKWTPEQCVDFLVDRVGHDRFSATGEVRRSFNGAWSPLYQAGYMIGSLQISALHRDLVTTGKMTDQQFHDSILKGGPMPIEMVRARLENTKIPVNFKPTWKFAN